MRSAFVGAFFAFLPLAAFAAPVTVPVDAVVMPDTPSGKVIPTRSCAARPSRSQAAASSDQNPALTITSGGNSRRTAKTSPPMARP